MQNKIVSFFRNWQFFTFLYFKKEPLHSWASLMKVVDTSLIVLLLLITFSKCLCCHYTEFFLVHQKLYLTRAIRGSSKEEIYQEPGVESSRVRRWYRKLCLFYKSLNNEHLSIFLIWFLPDVRCTPRETYWTFPFLYGYLQTLSTIVIILKDLNSFLYLNLAFVIWENINSSVVFRMRSIYYVVVASM